MRCDAMWCEPPAASSLPGDSIEFSSALAGGGCRLGAQHIELATSMTQLRLLHSACPVASSNLSTSLIEALQLCYLRSDSIIAILRFDPSKYASFDSSILGYKIAVANAGIALITVTNTWADSQVFEDIAPPMFDRESDSKLRSLINVLWRNPDPLKVLIRVLGNGKRGWSMTVEQQEANAASKCGSVQFGDRVKIGLRDLPLKTIQSRPGALALKEANPARSDIGCLKEANRKKRKLLCSQQEFPIFSCVRLRLRGTPR